MLGEDLMEGAWFWKAPIPKSIKKTKEDSTPLPDPLPLPANYQPDVHLCLAKKIATLSIWIHGKNYAQEQFYLHVRCSTIDLGHFTVVLANFIATFRLYSDNLLQATERTAYMISYLYLYSET